MMIIQHLVVIVIHILATVPNLLDIPEILPPALLLSQIEPGPGRWEFYCSTPLACYRIFTARCFGEDIVLQKELFHEWRKYIFFLIVCTVFWHYSNNVVNGKYVLLAKKETEHAQLFVKIQMQLSRCNHDADILGMLSAMAT